VKGGNKTAYPIMFLEIGFQSLFQGDSFLAFRPDKPRARQSYMAIKTIDYELPAA
jgi:hypothetical protein